MAAAVATVMTGVYVVIATSEGGNDAGGVAVFAVLMGTAAVAAGLGSVLPHGAVRAGLLAAAALILVAVGVLGIFSIGLPLLVAGLLAAGAAGASGGRGCG